MYFFFFQAEDGIRDDLVTGVQTCALPISRSCAASHDPSAPSPSRPRIFPGSSHHCQHMQASTPCCCLLGDRKSVVSGKRVDLGGRGLITKKEGLGGQRRPFGSQEADTQ